MLDSTSRALGVGVAHAAPPLGSPDVRYIVIHDTDISKHYKSKQLEIVNGSHRRRWGLESPFTGSFVCYHYFIGTTGELVRTRDESERMGCTRNADVNDHAIHVVMAGAFDTEKPGRRQLDTLRTIVDELRERYHVPASGIIGHREASPTTCPGRYVMAWIEHEYR